ncbi:uncharacterized protein LTR77_006126 [Saxophila tyrrhenica]|uniref:Uncharacterized protein n=1 Tax=Saxophila tyrrhenica TaxID=1690608 RepID=A0AAV9PA14_9PEZI|nr:hypothetical protein LTR77_006126 [Saxophila tyrrhenica]
MSFSMQQPETHPFVVDSEDEFAGTTAQLDSQEDLFICAALYMMILLYTDHAKQTAGDDLRIALPLETFTTGAPTLIILPRANRVDQTVPTLAGAATPTPSDHQLFGLPPRFPPPGSQASSGTPGVHHGPADSSSMATSSTSSQLSQLQARQPDPAREAHERGPPIGARDPMDILNEAPLGGERNLDEETIQRR